MKRLLSILTTTLLLGVMVAAGAILPSASQTPVYGVTDVQVSISAPAEVVQGKDFVAKVDISDIANLDADNFDISFDASILRLDNVTAGLIGTTAIPVDVWNARPDIGAGTYTIVQNLDGLSGVSGSGFLAELHFTAIGVGTSNIDIANGTLSSNTAEEIPATWTGGSVAVTPATAVSITAPQNVNMDSDFVARVTIGEVVDFDAANYDISFDPTVLEIVDADLQTDGLQPDVQAGLIGTTAIPVDIPNVIHQGTSASDPTVLRVVQNLSGLDGVTGAGYLAEIHFHVIGAAGSSSQISLTNGVLGNILALPIFALWTGASVHVLKPATFSVSQLTIAPAEVDPGQTVNIGVLASNTGELEGTYDVTLKINNVVAETKQVTLAAGASQPVTFTTSKNVAGTYAVDVNGLTGSFVVKGVAPKVTTLDATGITGSSATLNSTIVNMGGHTSLDVSFEWGTTSGALDKATVAKPVTAIGAFTDSIGSLLPSTTYFFRVKVTAGAFTVYGNELSFTTRATIATEITLVEGLNLIVLPTRPEVTFTSETLLVKIGEQGGNATEIYGWDRSGQGWKSHVRGQPFGNFNIEVRQGYFVKTTKASTLSYEGTELTIPVYTFGPRATNVSNAKFTISWTTASSVTGWIEYGTSPTNLIAAYDVRGAGTTGSTHYVNVTGLTSATTYYYDVISGGVRDSNGGSHYTVTTGPTLGPPGTGAIYGQVFKSNGQTPADGAIVYITTSGAQSLSALVGAEASGYWNLTIGELRTADLSGYFGYTGDTNISLDAQAATDGMSLQTVAIQNAAPAPNMTLGVKVPIDVVEGLNFMVLPGKPATTSYTSETILTGITGQGGNATEIYSWDKLGQSWKSHVRGQPFGNWNIETAQAYFIKTSKASQWLYAVAP